MKKILFLIIIGLCFMRTNAQTSDAMLIELHIQACAKLNKAAKDFDLNLPESGSGIAIMKYSNSYSAVIDDVLPLYKGNIQLENSALNSHFNDIGTILTTIKQNNNVLVNRINRKQLTDAELKASVQEVLNANKSTALILGEVTSEMFRVLISNQPTSPDNYSKSLKLSKKESEKIINLITRLFGETAKKTDLTKIENGYALSANMLHQALSLDWQYKKSK
ncbi:hypothetical protein J8J42_07210 [Chryseobacterium sp. cx-311]|uniref:hypothetical protein n=1 Tax=Marnyiella aurantia TaxID=2758037 RepID=UPI001AE4ED87|nr:hypothetical protein [Marnyiella aurantia]MBP0612831.1 hypothetical protein [Marnyiella aurantia]